MDAGRRHTATPGGHQQWLAHRNLHPDAANTQPARLARLGCGSPLVLFPVSSTLTRWQTKTMPNVPTSSVNRSLRSTGRPFARSECSGPSLPRLHRHRAQSPRPNANRFPPSPSPAALQVGARMEHHGDRRAALIGDGAGPGRVPEPRGSDSADRRPFRDRCRGGHPLRERDRSTRRIGRQRGHF